ncbi:hypothetical protein LO762_26200 [Actinocorallia sp. API 0066]|uniref:hypothetical protein n=1 Tax=Actinocorallia sp. API 0066 TaxID=2896846 RepID=UPI001E495727|nr:hypothetical protein [Actinocorallia sp. API 0066]MCD0452648.1 hypothetical protein [Actinocorallia sp. API 0066]
MTSVLAEAFGVCHCVDLVPLTRDEAVRLADSADGVSGEQLIMAAERAGAAVMASTPMTLELLVVAHQADGGLQGNPQDLFARSVTLLAEGPKRDRAQQRPITSTALQRLRVAGRIAAWTLLSGKRTVWLGPAREASIHDLPDGVLVDGNERLTVGSFEVTANMVWETLQTALFTRPETDRVAFRHSSITAYLAAKYLTDCGVDQRQLANLFLAGVPGSDTASIPAPLRETAAWLVALNPVATDWLAAADPESLAVHSALVRSDEVRRLTVQRLLERAPQVELSDTPWQFARWDLHHPGLADQLAEAIDAAPANGPDGWDATARLRLALRLAEEAGPGQPRLAEASLRVAKNDAWDVGERRLAVSAAFRCDGHFAVPLLIGMLTDLTDTAYSKRVDPEYRVRGTLLTFLWPEHLDVETLLEALVPPVPRTYNMYSQFLRNMPYQCPEADLPKLLGWVQDVVSEPGHRGKGFDLNEAGLGSTIVDALVERVLTSKHVQQLLEPLAKIICILIFNHRKVGLPAALLPDEEGIDGPQGQHLRRCLAQRLIGEAARVGVDPREAALQIVDSWRPSASTRRLLRLDERPPSRHQLLDKTDLVWLLDETRSLDDNDGTTVTLYGHLAEAVFPRNERWAFDLAYDEDHPAWPYLRQFYEPVDLDGEYARFLRKRHARRDERWSEKDAFLAEVTRLLAQVREGDNDSLWKLLRHGQVDLQDGRYEQPSGPIRTWPALGALGDGLADLPELALRYLEAENDRAETWIGKGLQNWVSWAGYTLLLELHAADRLAELSSSVWAAWSAAILSEVFGVSGRESARQDLLRMAACKAPAPLAERVRQIGVASLNEGQYPIELDAVDPEWAPELRVAMEELAIELASVLDVVPSESDLTACDRVQIVLPEGAEPLQAALRAWHKLIGSLLEIASDTGMDLVDAALNHRPQTDGATEATILAAQALMLHDARTHWTRVKDYVSADMALGRRLAHACARAEAGERITAQLDEIDVADLYRWLHDLFPGETAEPRSGFRYLGPDDRVHQWKGRLLRNLAGRGTLQAVKELRVLANRHPTRLEVAAALIAAKKRYALVGGKQVKVSDVAALLADQRKRIIRNSADLLEVTFDTLKNIEKDLHSHCELLWNRIPGEPESPKSTSLVGASMSESWEPKLEAALCAYLAHELRLRMSGHRVVVNREVLVHPTNAYGSGKRTDLLIEAIPADSDGHATSATEPLKLVIEVKGSWNDGVLTAQEEQLVGRYLPVTQAEAGIYLVGWYPIELWTKSGKRKTQAKRLSYDSLRADLISQSDDLARINGIYLKSMVMMISRPGGEPRRV